MTSPQINTLEYIRRALADDQNFAVVTQNNDGSLSISLDIGPGPHLVDLEALQGPAGPPGLPQFPLMPMFDVYTDPNDLPFDLTNTSADIGKFWLIDQFDETGCISSAAYIWFGTQYRVLPFGVQGPPGKYGVIKPYVTLLGPDKTSLMRWDGQGTPDDPYRLTLTLSIPEGPLGDSCPLFDMPDVSHDVPPVAGQFLTATGGTVTHGDDELPVWAASDSGGDVPRPYLVPANAFSSYSGVDFSAPVVITSFAVPPNPFPWKPLVWGQIEMYATSWFESLPTAVGCIVLLGDPDPEVGTLVGRGYGNAARGVVTIFPHCSYPQHPFGPGEPAGVAGSDSIAMTPWNDVAKVNANHTGQDGTLYVVIVNEGKLWGFNALYDFNAAGSSLFILACPMTSQDELSAPQYGGLTARLRLTGLVT